MKKLLFILAVLILIGSINALAERDTNNVSKKNSFTFGKGVSS
ncbi:hypothetical protein Thein_1706 [Thermodesulfatator indicus DSM 15286]|uniref:Uncharacterized protein n=1 Tax=Thermodesulfatator indicus (strain DSM 15286 / JCM 11887 / CIR29812) TaxID=667014 RepID=F8A9B6_THEID|nr:hypothetical protein [Thermodesulfatator indicus]AEH45564.1 hypothetical protein Thein_1706 [Thermodesulfatator indicus DSM 15286]